MPLGVGEEGKVWELIGGRMDGGDSARLDFNGDVWVMRSWGVELAVANESGIHGCRVCFGVLEINAVSHGGFPCDSMNTPCNCGA